MIKNGGKLNTAVDALKYVWIKIELAEVDLSKSSFLPMGHVNNIQLQSVL